MPHSHSRFHLHETASKPGCSRPRGYRRCLPGGPDGRACGRDAGRACHLSLSRPARATEPPVDLSRRPSVPGGSAPSTDRRRAEAGPSGPGTPPVPRSGGSPRLGGGGSGERCGQGCSLAGCPAPVPGLSPSAASPLPQGGRGRPGAVQLQHRGQLPPARPGPAPARLRRSGSPRATRLARAKPALPFRAAPRPQGFAEPPHGCRRRWGAAAASIMHQCSRQ